MTTTRRPIIDLLRRKVARTLKVWDDLDRYEAVKPSDAHTYFAEITVSDPAVAIRAVDLASLENFASQSLGPIDPRVLGRRADGSAIIR